MPHTPEHTITTAIRQYILTVMDTKWLPIMTMVKVTSSLHTGTTAGTTIIHTMTDHMVACITGMDTIGMLGDLTTLVTHGPIIHRMVTKNQMDTIATTSLQVTGITILWSTMAPLVDMMGMCMLTLGCHIIAIHTHTTHTQVLITTTITIQSLIQTLTLLHITQVAQAELMMA